jgi:hypothetical protein
MLKIASAGGGGEGYEQSSRKIPCYVATIKLIEVVITAGT